MGILPYIFLPELNKKAYDLNFVVYKSEYFEVIEAWSLIFFNLWFFSLEIFSVNKKTIFRETQFSFLPLPFLS